mmetsp:Transcript_17060/g.37450  ORF Transcript_17060/g.37450 Transcript_17060/m.37450 type:complete len:404 (+) Transcript_17060:46-1257(+)
MNMSLGMQPAVQYQGQQEWEPVSAVVEALALAVGHSDHAAWVAQVKDLQRQDHIAKDQWHAYVDVHGQGTRDPSKHTVEFLQGFLNFFHSGGRLQPADDAAELAHYIKMGQKKSQNWKNVWQQYCTAFSPTGKHDPATYDEQFLTKFLDYMAQLATMSMMGVAQMPASGLPASGLQPMLANGSEPSLKRARESSSMASSGDPVKDSLINRVKSFQRQGDQNKQLWWMYCDNFLGGVRDPSRHDSSKLQEFVDAHGVPEAQPRDRMPGGSLQATSLPAAVPGLDPVKDKLVNAVKSYQREGEMHRELWWNFCDTQFGGVRDPSRHDVNSLRQFLAANGVPENFGEPYVPGLDPVKDHFVNRVKQYQKGGEQNREIWATFCGHKRDPARHDTSTLQQFCEAYGVP